MTVSVHRCPVCLHRVIVRVKGTIATHYKSAMTHQLAANQCPGSRRTLAEALAKEALL
jgi:hypothetical protein